MTISAAQQARILDLARSLVRHALLGTAVPHVGPDDPILQQPAGSFVSLHATRDHQLRGCVGRIDATLPLLDSLRTAAEQVLRDPRFAANPVTAAELPKLEIEVSVLSAPQPAASPLDFDPQTQGIVLSFGKRTGCFLPQVARETGWTREQLLERLCTEKLDLPAASWKQPQAKLSSFSVVVIGPESFETAAPGQIGKQGGDC